MAASNKGAALSQSLVMQQDNESKPISKTRKNILIQQKAVDKTAQAKN